MDNSKNNQQEILDFHSFLKTYFPGYIIDGHNLPAIGYLGLWAARAEKFNTLHKGWHVDRGIILSGPVGVGKDELFRLLRKYLSYLRSPYGYASKIVWEFARPFEKDGYACFHEETGNIYYEELALTDEKTGQPTREYVSHYGTKLLIGSEIINVRYNVFKSSGYQTHFSTNLTEGELESVYGSRCLSRLYEMCNFIFVTGMDRRGIVAPTFLKNKMQPSKPAARETTIDEHMENKKLLDADYVHYCETGTTTQLVYLSYNLLVGYGCQLVTDEEMRAIMEDVASKFVEDAGIRKVTPSERARNKELFVWNAARKIAVEMFFRKMKEHGAKSIFRDVDSSSTLPPGEKPTNITEDELMR